jgi:hypothetical protein
MAARWFPAAILSPGPSVDNFRKMEAYYKLKVSTMKEHQDGSSLLPLIPTLSEISICGWASGVYITMENGKNVLSTEDAVLEGRRRCKLLFFCRTRIFKTES